MLSVIMPSVIMLSVVTMICFKLSVNNLSGISSEYHYSECRYFVLWVCVVVLPSVVMLSVVVLGVIIFCFRPKVL